MSEKFIKNNWKLIVAICAVITCAIYLIFGEHGLLYLRNRRMDLEEYTQRVNKQEQKKLELEQEVKRLQTDKDYLEHVIREETGKVKENEVRIVIKEKADERKMRKSEASGK